MKTNIKKLDRDGKQTEDSNFWTYDTYCDNCGQYMPTLPTIKMPDLNEKDLCLICKEKIILASNKK